MIEKLQRLSLYNDERDTTDAISMFQQQEKINEIIDVVNNLKPKLGFPVYGVTQQESIAEFEKKRRLEELARLRNEFFHPDPIEPHLKDK